MASVHEVLTAGIQHHQAGDLRAAEQMYRRVLQQDSQNADALHLLGVIALQVSKHQLALDLIQQATAINAHEATYWCNLGAAFQGLHRLDDAIAAFRRALKLRPDFPEAHSNLADALRESGSLEEALLACQRAIELNPNSAESHCVRGTVLREQGELEEALACFRHALQLSPKLSRAHIGLGTTLRHQGKLGEALAACQRAFELTPDFSAHGNLGNVLRDQGRLEEALAHHQSAVRLKPNYPKGHTNLGMTVQMLGDPSAAAACYQRALELDPNCVEAHIKLGTARKEQGQQAEALASFRRGLDLDPNSVEALSQHVHLQMHSCSWDDLEDNISRLRRAVVEEQQWVSPFVFLTLPTSPTEQRRCAQLHVERVLHPNPRFDFTQRPGDRLRLGYLSADFRKHPVASALVEIFEQHDRARFEVTAYSFGPDDESPLRERLVKAFDRFVDIRSFSYDQAARRIHEDGVDILIDLMGYTGSARTQILAMRPAPVQVNFLGYSGTLGGDFVDYIVVDDFVVPAEHRDAFTEQLIYMPGSYMANDSQRPVSAQRPSRSEAGLPETGFVFCAFNQGYKITPQVFDVWMRLLARVPHSVLWLLEYNSLVVANLKREAEERGVDSQRLVFAQKLPQPEHLARTKNADLFLDTWPVNAQTTATDALWVGCPLLTCPQAPFISRVAGSLLRTVGLPELIAESPEEYERLAVELASDGERLDSLRARLNEARTTSMLFDGTRFARDLEQAYEHMWQVYSSGRPPEPFAVPK